jgi:radical SAM protein with 4Fe4S-binding SPASM domain
MLSEEFSRKLEEKHIPFFSSIELTSCCNLRCKFCYLEHSNRDELSTEEIKSYLDQLASLGSLFLCLTGGEPLLRQDFWDIAQHAHSLGFALNLKTNGTLIDKKMADHLARLNLYRVDISLLGATPEVHDGITQVKGSLEKTISGVRFLRERDINVFLMSTVIKENLHELIKIKKLAEELGAHLATTPLVYPKNDSGQEPLKHRLSDEELAVYYRQTLSPDLRILPCSDIHKDFLICQAGRTDISINSQGRLYPCLAFPWEVGDLRKESLQNILENSERLSFFRSLRGDEFKACIGCRDSFLCARCSGLAYLEKGDMLGPSPENCRQTKIVKEVTNEKEKNLQKA